MHGLHHESVPEWSPKPLLDFNLSVNYHQGMIVQIIMSNKDRAGIFEIDIKYGLF